MLTRVYLFGNPRVLVRDQDCRIQGKQLALLALLAISPEGRLEREEAASLLWPRNSLRSARHSLSQAIYALKKQGLDDTLKATQSTLGLVLAWTDVGAFLDLKMAGAYRDAAEIYSGAFLEDQVFGEDKLDDWVSASRARFASEASELLPNLLTSSDWELSARLATDISKVLPYDQRSAEARMTSLRALGQLEEAEKVRHESEALFGHALRYGDFALGESFSDAGLPFLGRTAEMSALKERWTHTLGGKFSVVSIVGEAGIGKTALAERFQKLVLLKGGLPLWAQGFELERNVPYGIVGQWIQDAPADLESLASGHDLGTLRLIRTGGASLGPDEGNAIQIANQQQLHEALTRAFRAISEARPLVMFVDDAHWADDASLALLHYMSRRISDFRVLVVLCTREVRGGHGIAARWTGATEIPLGPLTVSEVAAGISSIMGDRSTKAADAFHARAGGNPLLLAAMLTDRRVDLQRLPISVIEHFKPRLSGVGKAGRAILDVLAVLSIPSSIDVLCAITDISPKDAESAIQDLERSGLIRVSGGEIRPRHGLLAEVVLREMSPSTERVFRGRVARVLAETGRASSAALAPQYDFAGNSTQAFSTALQAAEASRDLFAYAEAEFFYKIALSNAPTRETSERIRIALSDLYLDTARLEDAKRVLSTPLSPELSIETGLATEVQALLVDLHEANDLRVVERARELLSRRAKELSYATQARLMRGLVIAQHELGVVEGTVQSAQEAIRIATLIDDPKLRLRSLLHGSAVLSLYGSCERELARIEELLPETKPWADIHLVGLACYGSVLVAAGQLPLAERQLGLALELAERGGFRSHLFQIHNNLGVCLQEQGRFDEAFEEYMRARAVEEAPNQAGITLDNLALLHLERGNYEKAMEMTEDIYGSPDSMVSWRSWFSRRSVRGIASLEIGHTMEAFRCRRDIEIGLDQFRRLSNDVSYIIIFLARMKALEGDAGGAVSLLTDATADTWHRDRMCSARLATERIRFLSKSNPAAALVEATQLKEQLKGSRSSILARLDDLIARCT